MKLVFVTAEGQNAFFDELVAAIRDELDQLGVESMQVRGAFPAADPETAFVLIPPHEYFALTHSFAWPTSEQLRRTIVLCTEQRWTSFWNSNAEVIDRGVGHVFDINLESARTLASATGRRVDHFQLGWTRSWSYGDPHSESPEEFAERREIDALFLGSRSPRRDRALAGCARWLDARNYRFVLGDDRAPLTETNSEWLGGQAKWNDLANSKLLLNVHRGGVPYFEWLRVVQAIANGCVVLGEDVPGTQPLKAGEHFFAASTKAFGSTADSLLESPERLHEVACAAFDVIHEQIPMRQAVEQLCDRATGMLRAQRTSIPALDVPAAIVGLPYGEDGCGEAIRTLELARDERLIGVEARLGAPARDQKLELAKLRGEVDRLRELVVSGVEPGHVSRVGSSPAYRGASPLVSVVTPLHNYESLIGTTLSSAASSSLGHIELIVVDDGSTDGSLAAARRWMQRHPAVPSLLLAHPRNRGLGQARNTAIDAARGEYIFLLDADNTVLPHGIEKLLAAAEDDPAAAFAWGLIERHDTLGEPIGIVGGYGWLPERFRDGNYIDAMVLWRRSTLRDLGGFTTDSSYYGWEDFELMLRLAESGGHGTFVEQFVARYRASAVSMLSTANLAANSMLERLIESYPVTMGAHRLGAR